VFLCGSSAGCSEGMALARLIKGASV
jgi:hypothetical protein